MTATWTEHATQARTYLINLATSNERLEHATSHLRRANIPFERVDAVDGRNKSARDFSEYDDRMARRKYGRSLSGGEVGCFLSHRRCIEQFLATEQLHALVLEDDLVMPEDFLETLRHLLTQLDQSYRGEWDVVNLGRPPKKYFRVLDDFSCGGVHAKLCAAHYFPLQTFALLWTREGGRAFWKASRTIYAPVDQFLRDWCAETSRGFALTPPLVGVARGSSDIANRLSDRLMTNWLAYWTFKNLRLLRNLRRARQAMLAAGGAQASGGIRTGYYLDPGLCMSQSLRQ
jgi:glycosyl transferase, family 25